VIILDMGSGNTCRNEMVRVKDMIDRVGATDKRRLCTLKWQLWDGGTEPQCLKLDWGVFKQAYEIAEDNGFRTTASVFDKPSIDYLLEFDVPFVKIANRHYLRHLARYVPRGIPIVYSIGGYDDELQGMDCDIPEWQSYRMLCVSKYPATIGEYEQAATTNAGVLMGHLMDGISDHTIGLELWRKYKPTVYEKHFCLSYLTGPDAGPWALNENTLKELLDSCGEQA